MARSFRGLRGLGRKPVTRTPAPAPPPAPGDAPRQATNGQGSTPVPAATPSPRTPPPATPGVPPAGSAWPGAAPAVASSPPPPSAPSEGSSPADRTGGPSAGSAPPRRPGPARNDRAMSAQLKSLRRWQMVTAAWALSATVIAVLAFLTASNENGQHLAANAAQVRSLRHNTNTRLASVQRQLESLPRGTAVTSLNKEVARLGKVALRKDNAVHAVQLSSIAVSKRVTALETSVKALQAAQNSGSSTKTAP